MTRVKTTMHDPGLFGPDSVTWRVHADPAMVLGGLRALLLQAVHPIAMAGMADNTSIREDPWGRLERTATWVATVTYGSTDEAEAAGAQLRRVHAHLKPGVEPESSLPYRVDDPELLLWVHVTTVESFLSIYRRSGGRLDPGDADRYVDEMRTLARLVGLDPADVPRTEAEVEGYYAYVRPQLRVTKAARESVLWGLVPRMPRWVELATPARLAWASLVTTAGTTLPLWARRLYGLPGLPTTDLTATLSARSLRTALLLVPEQVRASPPRKAALARLAS